jgi:hypothetical protein
MRDSCGTGGQVRHLKVKRTNVAHRLPRGKRAPGTEINHYRRATVNRKTALSNEKKEDEHVRLQWSYRFLDGLFR